MTVNAYFTYIIGSLKSQSIWMITASVRMSLSHTTKEMNTKMAGMALGWVTRRFRHLRTFSATH